MKRETAKKIVETFSEEELADARLNVFVRNRRYMEHYGNGGDVEHNGITVEDPSFADPPDTYKIVEKTQKVINKKTQKVVECPMWMENAPKRGQPLWFLCADLGIKNCFYEHTYMDFLKAGNLYDSEEKAEAVREAIYGDGE